MKPLRQRDLVHQVVVHRATKVPTGKGGFSTQVDDVATLWAEVVGLNGREALLEHVMQSIRFIRMRVWYGPDIRAADQLLHDGVSYNVRSAVDPDGRRRELMVLADTEAAR